MHMPRNARSSSNRRTGPTDPRRMYSCITTRTVLRASARELSLAGAVTEEAISGLAVGSVISAQAYNVSGLLTKLFGVIFDLRRRRISGSRGLPGGKHRIEACERCSIETNRVGATIFDHVRLARGARNHHRMRGLGEHPGERQLGPAAAHFGGDRLERVEPAPVFFEIGTLETWHAAADVAFQQVAGSSHAAGEETPPEWAERHERDAQSAAFLEHGDLGITRPQRILRLQGGNRVYGMGLAQRSGADLRQADGADLPLPLQIRECADAVLERHGLVPTMQVVQIDAIGAEIAQRLLADGANGFRSAIDHPLAVAPEQSALAGEDDVRRALREQRAHQLLVEPESV